MTSAAQLMKTARQSIQENEAMDTDLHLSQRLAESNVSKIIYALVMPETEQVIDAVLDGSVVDRLGGRTKFHHLFREAWTQKQDAIHEGFFIKWRSWVAPIVHFDPKGFPFCYPTAGASEALREAIHAYAANSRKERFVPKIHVFEGEYEGFAAYAAAAGIEVQSHGRQDWQKAVATIGAKDQFYISQPSGIDGFVWDEFDSFACELQRRTPTAEIMLDLTYVGCVAREFNVNADHPNIGSIFLSLSKPAGVYYHRIGGMYSRKEYPGLFGNKWFKNLCSLSIGIEFMSRFGVQELPCKYRPVQQQVIRQVNQRLGLELIAADIFLLGVGEPSHSPSDLERYLLRGSKGEQKVRVCLTPLMAHAINPDLNPSVAARYYERIVD